jgi:hypothetical protein
MDTYGDDSIKENENDFACWECRHVITDDGVPIRRVEDMVVWLKAHTPPAENL